MRSTTPAIVATMPKARCSARTNGSGRLRRLDLAQAVAVDKNPSGSTLWPGLQIDEIPEKATMDPTLEQTTMRKLYRRLLPFAISPISFAI